MVGIVGYKMTLQLKYEFSKLKVAQFPKVIAHQWTVDYTVILIVCLKKEIMANKQIDSGVRWNTKFRPWTKL